MAYFYDPNSYANTLYGGPSPFMRRRPSPPPATYYPREAYDPYIRAVAQEQAARAQLQDAIKREREARQRREEEEAKAQMRERMRDSGRLSQRPQSTYSGYAPGYGYPDYSAGYSEPGYPQPQLGYGPGNYGKYGDMDMDYQDEYPQYAPYYAAPTRPKQQFQPAPRTARSQSRQPMYKRQPSPPQPSSPEDNAPKVRIPISSPSDKPKKPEASTEEKEAAALKIQSAYRIHHALNEVKALRDQFDQLMSSFTFPTSLDFDLSSPPQGGEQPKLMFNKNNAPLHAHEDTLLKLLQKLDAVESHGDRDVRERRRELVREVEKELERIDTEVRRQYEEFKAKAQPSESRKEDETMEVEPCQPAAEPPQPQQEQPVPATEKMDEDTQAALRPSSEADAAVAQPSESQSQPMDVEPSTSSASTYTTAPSSAVPLEQEPTAATSKTTTIEQHPSATNDSPAESEVETPPHASVALPQPVIRTADSESPPASSSHPVESADVEMRKEPQSQSSVSSAEHHKTHPVTVEEADDRDDAEVVVVEEAPPRNPPVAAGTEKEFVIV